MLGTKAKVGIAAGLVTLLVGAGVAVAHTEQKKKGGGGGGGGQQGGTFNPPPDDSSGLPPMFSNEGFPGGVRPDGAFTQDDFPGFSSDPNVITDTGPAPPGGGWVDENLNPPPNTRNDPNDPSYDPTPPESSTIDPWDPSTWGLGAVGRGFRRVV